MSISRFTASPGCNKPKVVTASVCGIIVTPNSAPSTALTVNETPSTAMLPFSAMNRASACGARKRQRVDWRSRSAASASPVPSTWPETRCPPNSSPSFSARSRLTRVPAFQRPSVVRASVSAEACTANQSLPTSMTVRQQPEQAIEAPSGMAAVSGHGAAMTRRISCPAAGGMTSRTVPSAVMMPVNIALVHRKFAHEIGTTDLHALAHETRHFLQPVKPQSFHSRPSVSAHDGRRVKPYQPVHKFLFQERCRNLRAAFHQNACDPLLGQSAETFLKIDAVGGKRQVHQLHTELRDGTQAQRIGPFGDPEPGGDLCRAGENPRREGNAQMRIGHHPHDRPLPKVRQPTGQFRIVGHHRSGADQYGIVPSP